MNFSIRAQGGATGRFERFSQNAIYRLSEPIYFDVLLHKVPLKCFKLQFKPKKILEKWIRPDIWPFFGGAFWYFIHLGL